MRKTFQQQAIERMFINTRQIYQILEQHAGRPGKSGDSIENIMEMEKVIDKYLPGIAEKSEDVSWAKMMRYWIGFKKKFENGNGSWTDSLKYIKKMYELFEEIQKR